MYLDNNALSLHEGEKKFGNFQQISIYFELLPAQQEYRSNHLQSDNFSTMFF